MIDYRSATTVGLVVPHWICLTLGTAPSGLRKHDILNEAHATGRDVQRLVAPFGLGINAAIRRSGLTDLHRPDGEMTFPQERCASP